MTNPAPWILYAFVSMVFAGVTAVLAKKGLTGLSGDVAMAMRTCFVFLFTLAFAWLAIPAKDWTVIKTPNLIWLMVSAGTTTLSWIFYYRAIALGQVSVVALIDKGSVVIAVVLACFILHEPLTIPKVIGTLLIVAGLVCISRG